MKRILHRLLPLATPLSLLVGLALLGSLWHEARQTRQLVLTLVSQDGQHTYMGMQAHMNAITTIQQLQEQTELLRARNHGTPLRQDLRLAPSGPLVPTPVKE